MAPICPDPGITLSLCEVNAKQKETGIREVAKLPGICNIAICEKPDRSSRPASPACPN